MIRGILAVVLLAALSPADYTECKRIGNGPIVKQSAPKPFVRRPDFAALTAYPKTMFFDGMPPPRFRYSLTMRLETGSVEKCGPAAPGYVFEACVRNLTVHMPNPCDFPAEHFARLLCHEQAHLQGWPDEHGT